MKEQLCICIRRVEPYFNIHKALNKISITGFTDIEISINPSDWERGSLRKYYRKVTSKFNLTHKLIWCALLGIRFKMELSELKANISLLTKDCYSGGLKEHHYESKGHLDGDADSSDSAGMTAVNTNLEMFVVDR
jgi:hypothetical protein